MKNLKVSSKLLSGFLVVALLAGIVGGVGIFALSNINNSSQNMYEVQTKPLPDISHAIEYAQRIRVQIRNVVLYLNDSEKMNSAITDLMGRFEGLETYIANYDSSIVNPEARTKFDESKDLWSNQIKPAILDIIANAQAGASQEELMEQMLVVGAPTDTMVNNFVRCLEIKVDAAKNANASNEKLFNLMLIIIITIIVIAITLAIIIGLYISGLISKPVKFITDLMSRIGNTGEITISESDLKHIESIALQKDELGILSGNIGKFLKEMLLPKAQIMDIIAAGDLTVNITKLSDKDTLSNSMEKMVDSLNNMFTDINSSTAQVSIGSRQIAEGSQTLAQGSTEQASAVTQLSESISNISNKTTENANLANKAAKLGDTIKNNAQKGSGQMEQMMTAVKEINEASQRINKVIKVIDDIAFQTNILALNAAVEAARAGQHGKGFAVVAEEVRNLAAKSAEAAKDTGGLITNTIEKAEFGSKIAEETSASLLEIVSGINESSLIVNDIAVSSLEQSEAIRQVNKGIEQVAMVVQQNSATAEQSAAASEEMSGQSDMLESLVSQFKIKGVNNNTYSSSPRKSTKASKKTLSLTSNDGFGKY